MSSYQTETESKHVSKRVQQTKREIEQLKSELQKLISRGIVANESVSGDEVKDIETKTTSETVCNNKITIPSRQASSCRNIRFNTVTVKSPQHTKATLRTRTYNTKEGTCSKGISQKERHYNVEEAREYIKKQKEKRLNILKSQVKQSQSVVDIRKEKLRELQAKSLELVKKNVVKKREKSRSRENLSQNAYKVSYPSSSAIKQTEFQEVLLPLSKNHFDVNSCQVPDLIVNNVEYIGKECIRTMCQEYSNKNVNEGKAVPSNFQNITIREHDFSVDNIPILQLPKQIPKYDLQHHAASTKIQAAYKGYRQRKLYRATLKIKKELEDKARKLAEEAVKRQSKQKEESNELADERRKKVPFWLEAAIQPYPYSFISAVKRKLNFAINTPSKTYSDVAVQSSLREPASPIAEQMTKHDIKMLLEESLKNASKHSYATSFLSHKCLDLDLKNVQALQLNVKSDVNGCDTEEISLKKSEPTKYSKKHKKTVENSGSDTSKNIPDISSESMCTIDSVSTSKVADMLTSSHHNEPICNLKINMGSLKKLKLRQKPRNNLSNPVQILSNDAIDMPDVNCLIGKNHHVKNQEITKSNEHIGIETHETEQDNRSRPKSASDFLHSFDKIHKVLPNFQRKDTIIAYNKSDYSKSKSSSNIGKEEISQEKNSFSTNRVENNEVSNCETSISNSKKSMPPESPNLKSFLDYMTNKPKISKKSSESNIESERASVQTKVPESFTSLLTTEPKSSDTDKTCATSTNTNAQEHRNSEANYSTNFSSLASTVPSLKRPSDTLTTSQRLQDLHITNLNTSEKQKPENVISLQPGQITCFETKTNTNQIHLKFEAELHLLNDFNESLRQFMAVEKSLLELQTKNLSNTTIYQHQDTQTSAPIQTDDKGNKSISTEKSLNSQPTPPKVMPTINYTRGSEVSENMSLDDSIMQPTDKSLFITGIELSNITESLNSTANEPSATSFISSKENYEGNVFVGLSLGMFDQLIKDEDSRIENLKTILKIREKALLDRTKGELAWLEIQKKQLIETGQLHEASLLKKKQRGIVIKLQHEKQEMQRLKQMQKAASKERKIILKEQRNMIKAQLSSNNVVTKIKRNIQKDRRQSGPVKVYNLHRETVNTETSISKRSSITEELIITSRSESIVSRISEDCGTECENINCKATMKNNFSRKTEHAKRSLLMREAALQKRRKAAEELLQWHQRLLEEEKKIAELEMAANTIINQVPNVTVSNKKGATKEKCMFKGSNQLNALWLNMTGREENNEEVVLASSVISTERISNDSKKHSKRNILGKNTSNEKLSKCVNKSSDLSDSIHIELISDTDSNSQMKTRVSEQTIKSISKNVSVTIENSVAIENSYLSQSKNNEMMNTNHSTGGYSSEFESPEIVEDIETLDVHKHASDSPNQRESPIGTDILTKEIDKSKSTLHEIMQNISNITDEISTIYKLSCASSSNIQSSHRDSNSTQDAKSICSETKNDKILNEESSDKIESDHSDSIPVKQSETNSVQSEIIKSLSELIKTQSSCQDIRSLQEHSVTETPEVVDPKNNLNESQNTLTSGSEVQTNFVVIETEETSNSKNLETSPLHKSRTDVLEIICDSNKSDNESNIVNSFKLDSQNVEEDSVNSIKETSVPSKMVSLVESCTNDTKLTSKNDNSIISKCSSLNEEISDKVKHTVDIQSNNSLTATDKNSKVFLDLSYGFVPCERIPASYVEDDTISDNELLQQLSDKTDKNSEMQSESVGCLCVSLHDNNKLIYNKENLISVDMTAKVDTNQDQTNVNKTDHLKATENDDNESQQIGSNKNDTEAFENASPNKTSSLLNDEEYFIHSENTHNIKNSDEVPLHASLNNVDKVPKPSSDSPDPSMVSYKLQQTEIFSAENTNLYSGADFSINIGKTTDSRSFSESSVKCEEQSTENGASDLNISCSKSVTAVESAEDVNVSKDKSKNDTCLKELAYDKDINSNNKRNAISNKLEDKLMETIITNIEDAKSFASNDTQTKAVEIDKNHNDFVNTEDIDSSIDEESTTGERKREDTDIKDNFDQKDSTSDNAIDVKKRVSEILADAHGTSREDKSPRLQDIYTTTYDILSPEHSPEIGSPVDTERDLFSVTQLYGEEAEALFKKQLAIEQEIKQLEQQQKEHIPYLYMREIPNKPPPPYTPPSAQIQIVSSVLPLNVEQVGTITSTIAETLHEAYKNGCLLSYESQNEIQSFSDKTGIDKDCYEFVFDLCKEMAIDHYKPFREDNRPSWLKIVKNPQLARNIPLDRFGLERFLYKKVQELLGFEKVHFKENMIIKWSRKKRDHVDELLVLESQTEESEWTNYDEDEIIVKNEVTNDIMNMLIQETASVMNKILRKKTFLY